MAPTQLKKVTKYFVTLNHHSVGGFDIISGNESQKTLHVMFTSQEMEADILSLRKSFHIEANSTYQKSVNTFIMKLMSVFHLGNRFLYYEELLERPLRRLPTIDTFFIIIQSHLCQQRVVLLRM